MTVSRTAVTASHFPALVHGFQGSKQTKQREIQIYIFSLPSHLVIISSINWLIVWNIKCQKILKNIHLHLPEHRDRCQSAINQQSKKPQKFIIKTNNEEESQQILIF